MSNTSAVASVPPTTTASAALTGRPAAAIAKDEGGADHDHDQQQYARAHGDLELMPGTSRNEACEKLNGQAMVRAAIDVTIFLIAMISLTMSRISSRAESAYQTRTQLQQTPTVYEGRCSNFSISGDNKLELFFFGSIRPVNFCANCRRISAVR
jgi:hypothetical protein